MARILTLTNWYPPHHFGGYEVLCRDVMTSLHHRGHQIEVLCSDQSLPGVTEPENGPFPILRQLEMYWRDGMPWTPGFKVEHAIERANQQRLKDAIDRFKPDVVSVWHMGALSLNLLTTLVRRRTPLVYAICDEWLIYGIELDAWARRWYPNPISRAMGRSLEPFLQTPNVVADIGGHGCFCFLSEHTKKASMETSPWTYRVGPVVYPGIDLDRFTPGGTKEWDWRLLYMGRLDGRKGIDTLLRSLVYLPQAATLSVLGRGEADERARLEAIAADLGVSDRVHFDAIHSSDLADAYRTHDCVVFPSEWAEPFGMVPIEAMACGTPVVTTAVGGLGEYLVDRVNSVVVEPKDERSLADGISLVASDASLRDALRRGGLATAARFDVRQSVDAYEHWHVAAAEGRLSDVDAPPSGAPSGGGPRTRLSQWWRGWHR